MAAAQRAPGSWRGKGLGMGQRENPNAIHRANFPGAAFVRCLSACTWQRHSPRAISSGHSQHSPCRPQPGPASPGVTAWCLGLIRAPGQCCRAHKDTCGTGATRTSPEKRFLTLARTKHIPDLSHCPPKLLVSPPCPQTPQETTAITAISINPHLCTYVKKLIMHSWVHFQGFSVHGQGSLEGHQRDISRPSHPSASGWSGQSSLGMRSH